MDKGKAPMTPGYEKRLKQQQQQQRRQPELLLGGMRNKQNNQQHGAALLRNPPPQVVQQKSRPPLGQSRTYQQPGGAPMSLKEDVLREKRRKTEELANEIKLNEFYYRLRKYTTRRVKKGRDWVPSKQELEDEAQHFPEVHKLFYDRVQKMGEPISESRYNRHMNSITKECNALQSKLDKKDESAFWADWGVVRNMYYDCRQPFDADKGNDDDDGDDDEDYYVDITQS